MADETLESILQDATDDEKETNTFRRLRGLIDRQGKSLKEAREEADRIKGGNRVRDLKDALKGLSVREGVAKFYPSDADVSEEAVKKWLEENAEDLGVDLTAGATTEPSDGSGGTPAAGSPIAAAAGAIAAAADRGVGPTGGAFEQMQEDLKQAKTREDLDAVYAKYA